MCSQMTPSQTWASSSVAADFPLQRNTRSGSFRDLVFADRYTSDVIFLMHFAHNHTVHITLHGSSVCMRASFHLHVIHDVCLERSLSVSSCLSFSCFSPSFTSSLPHSTCTLTSTSSPMSTASREITAAPSHNEE